MSNINKAQQEALNTLDGPVLIIAGPGSGKTFTLVERIVKLIQVKGVQPESILVVTFTEKAARELTTRISNRLLELKIDLNLNEMYLGTFHSICLRILEENQLFTRLKCSFSLYDQFDQQFLIYKKMKVFTEIEDFHLLIKEDQSRWNKASQLLSLLNKVTEEALTPDELTEANDIEVSVLGHCLKKYHELLEENNALDFSTIQYETLTLLENQPQVLADLQEKLKYLMVDEYQDTNTIQERILKLLMGQAQNLCVVGDDDQGLYRFRGATIRNILEFPKNFDSNACKQIQLTTNYRSHPDIVNFFGQWMQRLEWGSGVNRFRYDKNIRARDDEFPNVPSVLKVTAEGREAWYEENYQFLLSLKNDGLTDWNQVAFLFRSVQSERAVGLANYLEEKGIPVYSPRSNQFFDREEIKLVIGLFIFLFPKYFEIRKWTENLNLTIWDYYDHQCVPLMAQEMRKPENLDLLKWAQERARVHHQLVDNTDYGFTSLFYQALQFPIFSRYFTDEALNGLDKGRAARNLSKFSSLLAKFEHLHYVTVISKEFIDKNLTDLFNQYFRFLKEGGIGEYEDDSEYAPSGCVSFLTIHQSKGLEYPVVITCSLEGVPRKSHIQLDETLENNYFNKPPYEPFDLIKNFDFWRLYYTAFSRAQNLLVLSAEIKTGHGASPSKYFKPIVDGLVNWRHPELDLSLIQFAQVKEMNLKREYAFTSHILLFEACPEQYRFFKELEFHPVRAGAQIFGTLVHQTIEDIHKAVLRNESHLVTHEQIQSWLNTNYIYLSKKERQFLAPSTIKAIEKHVLNYYDREKQHLHRLQEAEVEISLVKDQYILKGSIDLIRGEHGTVEIIDFKSERKPDLEKEKSRLETYQRQLQLYAHLLEEKTGQTVSRMHLYYTGESDGSPYVSFDKKTEQIERTVKQFDQVVSRIEAKDYGMTCRPDKLCPNCDMRFYCDRKNWNFVKESL
ncbi:ATP-dependent helicase [Acinetobacter baumannii]|uniref:ATP-dependent helicase n=1 Tax=Acinetobacter TaxID=469 RepID=UPI00112CBC4B|nr:MULTISPECIES: ATP-dependent DNA helicase [Acinetobacter]MBE4722376.1 ATP-dependent helicase [Acinetobacter baumannii]MBR8562719.1 ATP-dependent helicase [Acinetobacter baumannii]MBR8622597.1 ATP-dependent helicase [Acinetobacter baumannii]TPR93714.1 ATP-dependent helicase [Acinetobacter baumannii]WOQ33185.1 ATP-dependent DNA helicase [Acinetobacter baumannii]